MFDTLSQRLDTALEKVRGRGRLDERTVDATLKEIRLALLEADVNFRVVRDMVDRLREQLVGAEGSKSLNPSQQVVKAVSDELERALGGTTESLRLQGRPAVIMLAGLQGAGKTTAAGKLAAMLKSRGRNPMLVACDLQRPAAVEQLKVNAKRAGVHVYAPETSGDPVPVAEASIAKATETGCDVVIVDTAGRLAVDEVLLDEARRIREVTAASTTLFVIDAMIGQEAVNVARAFQDQVGFDGVILSKLDGDARGGAALSVREVTGAPILFASVGEKLEDFEVFHPDRMAQRILGMGDVMSLIEKAEATYTQQEADRAEQAMLSGDFTLEDFLAQMQMIRRMGPLQGLMGMMPGMGRQMRDVDIDERQVSHMEAIIQSMTPEERRNPKLLNGRRRKRIAAGAGRSVPEINRLVKQFEQLQKVMKSAAKMAGQSGNKPTGMKGQAAQAAALRKMQADLGGGGAQQGLGGFPGLQPGPKGGRRSR
ncbi:MAG: signal recognition particle protein [Nitriliruptoraceae bacterium]